MLGRDEFDDLNFVSRRFEQKRARRIRDEIGKNDVLLQDPVSGAVEAEAGVSSRAAAARTTSISAST